MQIKLAGQYKETVSLNIKLEGVYQEAYEGYIKINGEYRLFYAGILFEHLNNMNNPHNVTKAQIGLGDVENVSYATPLETRTLTIQRLTELGLV